MVKEIIDGVEYPISQEVISKTYAELVAMVAGSQLVVGQQYLLTNYQTKYIQYGRGKIKIAEYDLDTLTPTQNNDAIEPLLLLAISNNSFSTKAYSTVYDGNELIYDFTNNNINIGDWNLGEYYIYGDIKKYDGNYYRLITESQADLTTPPDTNAEWLLTSYVDNDFNRTGWIKERIDTINRVRIGWDYKRIVFPRYKPNFSAINTYNGAGSEGEVFKNNPFRTGYVNNSLLFKQASSQYIPLTNINDFYNSDYAISFWVKTTSSILNRVFMVTNEGNHEITVNFNNGVVGYSTYEGGYANVVGDTTINDGAWHHVVITKSGTTGYIYVDGSLDESGTVNQITTSASHTTIGAVRFGAGTFDYLDAELDEMQIYNRYLDSTEVSDLYSSPSTTLSGAIHRWSFDESVNNFIIDSIGDNDGELINFGYVNSIYYCIKDESSDVGLTNYEYYLPIYQEGGSDFFNNYFMYYGEQPSRDGQTLMSPDVTKYVETHTFSLLTDTNDTTETLLSNVYDLTVLSSQELPDVVFYDDTYLTYIANAYQTTFTMNVNDNQFINEIGKTYVTNLNRVYSKNNFNSNFLSGYFFGKGIYNRFSNNFYFSYDFTNHHMEQNNVEFAQENIFTNYFKDNDAFFKMDYNKFYGDENSGNVFGLMNTNTFRGSCMNNKFDGDTNNNVFSGTCKNNKISSVHKYNTWGGDFEGNIIGYWCADNSFEQAVKRIVTGTDFRTNLGYGGSQVSDTTFGEGFQTNILYGFRDNTIGNGVEQNTFGDGFEKNEVGHSSSSNTFGDGITYTVFAQDTVSATFENGLYQATAIGDGAKAFKDNSIALGTFSEAYGESSISLGYGSKAYNREGIAIGSNIQLIDYKRIGAGLIQIGTESTRRLNGILNNEEDNLIWSDTDFQTNFEGQTTLDLTNPATNGYTYFDNQIRTGDVLYIWDETNDQDSGYGTFRVTAHTSTSITITPEIPTITTGVGDLSIRFKQVPLGIFSHRDDQNDITKDYLARFEPDGTLVFDSDATVHDDMLVELRQENTDLYATSGTSPNNTSVTGTVANTYKRNGINWTIQEGGSAGRMVEMTFDDARQVPTLIFSGQYVGSTAHASNLTWVAYNWNTTNWDTLTFTWTNATLYNDAIVTGFNSNHISNTGQVKVGVNHGSTTINTHYLYLDEVRLVEDNQPRNVFWKGGRIIAFRNTGYDMNHYKGQLSHRYKLGTDLKWHVHFTTFDDIPDGETIIFNNTYTIAGIFKSFASEATITATFTNDATTRATYGINNTAGVIPAGEHLLVPGDNDIDGTDLTISTIISGEILRDVGTFAHEVGVLYTDFHFEIDMLGSREQYKK